MLRLLSALCVALVIVGTAGCGSDTPSNPTPLPDPITVVFNGTLIQASAATHRVISRSAGEFRATLTTVLPDPAIAVGLSLGTWNGNSCTVIIDKSDAVQGSLVVGTVTGIGELCVRIYDAGRLVEPITYDLTVVHP
jgi:hypothetical protein